ncbi:MAG: hypothetical protein QXN15_10925 [Candidatus Jordarchaeales archaeon]|nr:hypothetical protein [Candidatus Jordarchaeia archaeon]
MAEKALDSISEGMFGRRVTLSGLVVNCKSGPCLKLKNGIVYIPELENHEELVGKTIYVTGLLLVKKIIPDPQINNSGAVSTGAYGDQLVLENISEIKID